MSMENKERLETLRQDLIELFATCARDVRAALHAPEINQALPKEPENHSIGRIFEDMGRIDPAKDVEFNRKLAKNIAKKYSYAYALCNSEEALARDGQMLADGMIARWGRAQMLKVLPELIDDPDPAIQKDIADLLQRVEYAAASFKGNSKDGHNLFHTFAGLNAVDEDAKLKRLESARQILMHVQKISLQNMSGPLSYAAP